MSVGMNTQCLMCHFRRNLEVAQPLGTEEEVMAFAKDMMRMYLSAPEQVASPYFNPLVEDLLHRHFGTPADRFAREREASNAFVLSRMDAIRAMAEAAEDPVFAGLQLAILGNYLDFSALGNQVSFEKLEDMIRQAMTMELDREVYAAFRQDLAKGKKLLYLTDNAGEIGFDRVFAEQIAAAYPHLEITFCVRGAITINDATRADAEAVGIPFPVIDNGSRIPGTQLDMLGQEAKTAIEEADVILAKGMANCETMYGCGYNVYYAFLVKCQRFVDLFHQKLLTPMLVKEQAGQSRS